MMPDTPSSNIITDALPFAASVALLTAHPTSACLSAGASLTPSPVIATTKLGHVCKYWQIRCLSDGNTSAIPSNANKLHTSPAVAFAAGAPTTISGCGAAFNDDCDDD